MERNAKNQNRTIPFTGIDHFVLTVTDVESTCSFYERLGGERVRFGSDRTAIQFGDQKINIHPIENDIDVVAESPTPGAGDFCLITGTSIETVTERLAANGIEISKGAVERTGARGPITSVYVRDPDDNLVEIGTYHDS